MATILRPGVLVSAKTAIRGGVTYERKDLDPTAEAIAGAAQTSGSEISRWETTRVIEDHEEHDRAVKVRSRAGALIRRECSETSFGLLCPTANEQQLDAAVAGARRLADEFNSTASHTTVSVFVLKGRIADSDEEATRAIADEIAGLLGQMEEGVKTLDAGSIRSAANRAREMESLLDAQRSEQVGKAVQAARRAAREIVKRVEKGGESAEAVLRDLWTGPIEKARFAFLELGESQAVSDVPQVTMPAVSVQRFGGLDLDEAAKGLVEKFEQEPEVEARAV